MSKITKKEKTLREGINKWKNFLNEGAFKKTVTEEEVEYERHTDPNFPNIEDYPGYTKDDLEFAASFNNKYKDEDGNPYPNLLHNGKPVLINHNGERYIKNDKGQILWLTTTDDWIKEGEVNEARMGEYGKIDAEDGNPPTKIGRGNEEYMAAYNAVLVARGEEPLDIQKPDQAYLDALRSGQLEEGGSMAEYGKIDAEDGNPPSKIGRGNEEYMAAYNSVLQARGEQPLDIQQPDQAYLDALRSGKLEEGDAEFKVGDKVIANGYPGTITDLSIPGMATVALKRGEVSVPLNNIEKISHVGDPDVMYGSDDEYDDLDERSADDERDLEEPVKYGTGHELEWDPKEERLYDRKRDVYLTDEEEDAVVAARQAEVDRKHKEFDMRRQNKEFGSAPYHFEEGAGHDESLAQAQNQGVAFIRGQDDKAAGKEKDPNFSEESGRNPLEVLFYNAGYDSELSENFSAKTEGANPAMNLQSKAKGKAMGLLQTAKAMAQAPSHEPARGYAAAVAKGAGEIVDLMVELEGFQASGYMEEAIGMQNIEKRRKPAAAPAAGEKINPTTVAKQFIKDKGYDKHFDLSDVFKVMALTDYLRKAGADTEEKVKAAIIDYIQHDGRSLKEGSDKEARIRDVVKMGSWDNIDGVPLSLPQAELLVAAMDNLSPANKEKLMAMPIDKMLDIVNKMVDAGVITVNYGRAGLREVGASRTTYSSDPELDQIEDIAKDMLEAGVQNSRIPVGLMSVASALKAQGFDASVSSGVLNIDGKYFMGKESKFDISPDEDVRRVMGYVIGYMG